MKILLKGNRFQDEEEMKRNVMFTVPKGQFQKCFGQWKDRWNKCVLCNGDYFEGDQDCNTIGYSACFSLPLDI
jgi:hypothetical protein